MCFSLCENNIFFRITLHFGGETAKLGGQPYKKEKANGFAVHFFLIITYSLPTTWSWRWRRRSTWAMWLMVSWVWSTIMVSLVVVASLVRLTLLTILNLLSMLVARRTIASVIPVITMTWSSSAILSVVMVTRT